jgi:hypothetical protein
MGRSSREVEAMVLTLAPPSGVWVKPRTFGASFAWSELVSVKDGDRLTRSVARAAGFAAGCLRSKTPVVTGPRPRGLGSRARTGVLHPAGIGVPAFGPVTTRVKSAALISVPVPC